MAPAKATARKPTGDVVEPAPSNPASLLWAHQLKREHGFLLDRMHKMESEMQALSGRCGSVAATAAEVKDTMNNVSTLREDVVNIIDNGKGTANWIESTKPRLQIMEQDIESANHLHPRLLDLETVIGGLRSEAQNASFQQQSIMERIQKVEVALQEKCSELNDLVKTNYQNDARDLRYQLDSMESRCKEEEEKVKAMQDEINSLKQTFRNYSASSIKQNTANSTALFSRDHPLLSAEASTKLLETLNSGFQQALASPLSRQMDALVERAFREESPTLSAQMRRTSRTTKPSRPLQRTLQRDVQTLQTQRKTQSPSETPDLDAPYRQSQGTTFKNAWRIHSQYEPRQTRSQMKENSTQARPAAPRQPRKRIVVLKVPQGRCHGPPLGNYKRRPTSRHVQLSYSKKPSQAGLTTQSPTRRPIKTASKPSNVTVRRHNPKRGRRREIVQLEDLDTFMAACPP